MDEEPEESEISQRHKARSMDPGKLAFVQKYLEDVQDTRSMTTEASDSGLATHTAASEIETEEINGNCQYIVNFCKQVHCQIKAMTEVSILSNSF